MGAVRSDDFATTRLEHRTDRIAVQLNQIHLAKPMDDMLRTEDGYRLDLSLTTRQGNPRARYSDRWDARRFEAVGPLFLARKGERLQARSDAGTGKTVVCQLRPAALETWFGGDLEWTDRRLEASLDLRSPQMKALLHRMGAEIRSPGFAHEVLVESLAMQLAVELRRYCLAVDGEAAQGGLSPWRLRMIEERLEATPAAPTLGELAALCGLSERQLTRGFRVSRGCSIADHVAAWRVGHARRMIGEGQGIKLIADALGFGSVSSFTYSFRRSTGLTPGQYREMLAQGSI